MQDEMENKIIYFGKKAPGFTQRHQFNQLKLKVARVDNVGNLIQLTPTQYSNFLTYIN